MSGEPALNLPAFRIAFSPSFLSRQAALVALALLTAAAAMIVARRLAGALLNPLEPILLLAASLLVAAAAVFVRVGWLRRTSATSRSRLDGAVMVWTSLAAVALTIGLCLRGTPLAWLLAAGTCLAVEECWAWPWFFRRRREPCNYRPVSSLAAVSPVVFEEDELKTPDPFSEEIVQQLTRRRAADGTEEIFGRLRAPVAPGQRNVGVHVAFCPPMDAVPEIVVKQIEGPASRIKTSQRLPYGARIDLKLASPAEESTTVLLQFSARAPRVG